MPIDSLRRFAEESPLRAVHPPNAAAGIEAAGAGSGSALGKAEEAVVASYSTRRLVFVTYAARLEQLEQLGRRQLDQAVGQAK